MDDENYAWVQDFECFGATVVEGMTGDEAVRALTDGDVTPLDDWRDADDLAPTVGVLDGDGSVLLWENYPWIGLDPRVPRRLSASGRCVSVAYGMTQTMLTVAETGRTVRAFEPLLRGPEDPDAPWYDEEYDPESDRVGDPLPPETEVDWSQGRSACLRFVELLTGVEVPDGLWDDIARVRWFTYDQLPPAEPVLTPLQAVLGAASPAERHARLRAGLIAAARILGLETHQPFMQALQDGDAVLAAAGSGPAWRPDPGRDDEADRAVRRLHAWEFPLGQRVEPLLFPVPGENWPLRKDRYRATDAEKAELRLAMACSSYLCQAGLSDDYSVGDTVVQLEQAVGDRFSEVEAAMLADPSGA